MTTVDVFISHAHEDKDAVTRELARALVNSDYAVWYDEYTLRVGDSVLQKIDQGLAYCRFAIVILSPSFMRGAWTRLELTGLVERETRDRTKRILPVWHKVTADEVAAFSLTMSGRLAVSTDAGIPAVVETLIAAMGPPTARQERATQDISAFLKVGDPAQALADAVDRAREYLGPQPLSVSDAIASAVRRSFADAGVQPTLVHILPYLTSTEAAYRVVGYFATQVAAQNSIDIRPWALELAIGFGREDRHTRTKPETRPLWQLLVAVDAAIAQNLPRLERQHLRAVMADMLHILNERVEVDRGGQCKQRLKDLLKRLPS